jgi:cytidyltransferase-like protein
MAENTVAMVSGTYDVLHAGHIRFLNDAKQLADKLIVVIAGDATLWEFKRRRPIMPAEHRRCVIGALEVVDEVFIADDIEQPHLNFRERLCSLQPTKLVVTEDDQFEQEKRQLCDANGVEYVQLPKNSPGTLFGSVSATTIRAQLGRAVEVPVRIDFGGGWLDVARYARPGGLIANCAISPLVTLNNWPYALGGGVGGSAAKAVLEGRNAFATEADLDVGWQDPAAVYETGCCVWASGPRPRLLWKNDGAWLRGLIALRHQGGKHRSSDMTHKPRDYETTVLAGQVAAAAVRTQDVQMLAAGISLSHQVQLGEGMDALSKMDGELASKYVGSGWGGYSLHLFPFTAARQGSLDMCAEAMSVEPYIRPIDQR